MIVQEAIQIVKRENPKVDIKEAYFYDDRYFVFVVGFSQYMAVDSKTGKIVQFSPGINIPKWAKTVAYNRIDIGR